MKDKFDDGGTPAWRANQETWRQSHPLAVKRTSPVRPQHRPDVAMAPPLRSLPFWRRWTFFQWLLAIFLVGYVLPWAILIGGILGAYSFDVLSGKWPPH